MPLKEMKLLPLVAVINLYALSFYHFYQFFLNPIRFFNLSIGILLLSSLISSANTFKQKGNLKFYFSVLSSFTIVISVIIWLIFIPWSEIIIYIPLIAIPLIYILAEGTTWIRLKQLSLR